MGFASTNTRAPAQRGFGQLLGGELAEPDFIEFENPGQASLQSADLGYVRLMAIAMGRHHVGLQLAHGSARASAVRFVFQQEGIACVQQRSGAIELRAGEWCGLRKDEAYTIAASGHSRQLAVSLPIWFLQSPHQAVAPWARAEGFASGAAHVFHAAASAAVATGGRLGGSDAVDLGAHLIPLLEIALRGRETADSRDWRSERRLAALEFIEGNLANPALGVPLIAEALGCSPRMVHKLFESEALTVAREILDRRLERCRQELADPVNRRPLSELARYWGFSTSQNFTRAFKHRFGSTPREYRSRSALNRVQGVAVFNELRARP